MDIPIRIGRERGNAFFLLRAILIPVMPPITACTGDTLVTGNPMDPHAHG